MGDLSLSSPSFNDNSNIPSKFTCQGEDINPELQIEGIPEKTASLVLVMDDPDAPMGTWVHWVLWNVPKVEKIEENSVPEGAVQGRNSWGSNDYGGPCPPSGTHKYVFKLYALDTSISLDNNSGKDGIERAMDGHILAEATLTGLYSKGN